MNQLLLLVEQVQFLQPQEPPQDQLWPVLLGLAGYQHSQVLHLVCTRLFLGHVHVLML